MELEDTTGRLVSKTPGATNLQGSFFGVDSPAVRGASAVSAHARACGALARGEGPSRSMQPRDQAGRVAEVGRAMRLRREIPAVNAR